MKIGEPLAALDKSYANYILSSIEETISVDSIDENGDILSDIQEIRRA